MDDLSPSWTTSLAILALTGSTVTDEGDHLVVRTPQNPTFHWGNCIVVRSHDRLGDAVHWQDRFTAAHPDATWLAVGLPRMPDDVTGWTEIGATLEENESLTTSTVPRLLPAPDGYRFAAVTTDDDWEQQVQRSVRENLASGEHEAAGYETFLRAQAAMRRDLVDRGLASWFGAFTPDGLLVADLGIVLCGSLSGRGPSTARYQAVGTDAEHRGRGVAGHLLGVAGAWAAERGARQWVIVTGTSNPAGRLYRGVGFVPDVGEVEAGRRPA